MSASPAPRNRRGVLMPAAMITQSASTTVASSSSTPMTRPERMSNVRTPMPSRICAPCRRASSANASVVLSGLAWPSPGQSDAASTSREINGATARIDALSGRNESSSPSARWRSTIARITSISSGVRASRRLPPRRYSTSASRRSCRFAHSAIAAVASGSSAGSRPDCRTPPSVQPDAIPAIRDFSIRVTR